MDTFFWINQFYKNVEKKKSLYDKISQVIPDIFDEYYEISWTVGIIDSFPFNNYPNDDSIKSINQRIRICREHNIFLNPNEDELYREVTLKEISTLFNVPYNSNTLSYLKDTPGIKYLDDTGDNYFKKWLSNISKGVSLNLFIEDTDDYLISKNRESKEIKNISISDYLDIYYESSTYLFPDNKDWCLVSSEEFPIFIGVSKQNSNTIRKKCDLELFNLEYI